MIFSALIYKYFLWFKGVCLRGGGCGGGGGGGLVVFGDSEVIRKKLK